MADLKWYVLRVVSGQEKKVKAYLEKEVVSNKLQDYVSQVLTPSEKVYQNRKMKEGKVKKIAVERQFFPGYVMVEADLSNGEVIHLIKNVPGVINFLEVDGSGPNALPKPMRESEINRLFGNVADADENEIRHDISFSIGEPVKVIDGPFQGFSGVVDGVFDEKKKISVIVKIFGRTAPVELNYVQVEKE